MSGIVIEYKVEVASLDTALAYSEGDRALGQLRERLAQHGMTVQFRISDTWTPKEESEES